MEAVEITETLFNNNKDMQKVLEKRTAELKTA